jgi:hypothetical protein
VEYSSTLEDGGSQFLKNGHIYQSAWHHIPEDSNFHSYHCKNLKYNNMSLITLLSSVIMDFFFYYYLSGVRLSLVVLRPLLAYCTSPT